jgi:hypothetical protein
VGFGRLRRLTKTEYNQAVREVLGEDGAPADRFVTDEKPGAFFRNAEAEVTDTIVQHYTEAAERIAERAAGRLPQLFPCRSGEAEPACAARLVETVGGRLYRRPLADEERKRLLDVYAGGREGADFKSGVRMALATMLQSPHFLYHVEIGGGAQGDVAPLAPHEVAARLAWVTALAPPDAALLQKASSGELASPAALAAEARRRLTEPRALAVVSWFFEQWLSLERLELAVTSEPLRTSMRKEVLAFGSHGFADGRATLEALLLAGEATLDDRMARHYGVSPGASRLDPNQRAGLLTRAAFLSAVHNVPARGKFVLNSMLCHEIELPADVDTTLPPRKPGENPRAHFDRHRENPACNGCHQLIDPIGHAFWHYDELGRYVTEVDGWKVDARGGLAGTETSNGAVDGAIELSKRLAAATDVGGCMVRQWFRFAIGREPDPVRDACSLQMVEARFAASKGDLRELLIALTETPAFSYRRTSSQPQEVK